jgi:hypothetical protein
MRAAQQNVSRTIYPIKDAEGRLVAEHHRLAKPGGEKECFWKLAETGNKDWGLNGTSLADFPLYGAECVADWDEDALIVVVEGEKARDALKDAGPPAVGTVTGASGMPGPAALEVLRDRRVCLWPDGDDPGRKHMERGAEGLHGTAAEVLFYTWHDAPEDVRGPDAADHPAVCRKASKGLDMLLTDLEGAPRWEYAKAVASTGPETFTAADLLTMELPPPKWAVPGIVPEGVILLAGKPKLGKAWMALGLAVAIATGGRALATEHVDQGEVLYLALEDNQRRLQKRLRKLLASDAHLAGLHIALGWRRPDQGGVEDLNSWLKEHPDARLVVVGTLKKIRPRTSGNRSVYEVDYEALEPLLPLAAEHGVAIIVVHHTRKADADDPLDTITGSTGLTGGVDGALVLKRERGRADAFLHVTGRDIEEDAELALKWDADAAGWAIIGDAEEYRLSEKRAKIVRVLEETGEPMTPTEVADVLGENVNSVKLKVTHHGSNTSSTPLFLSRFPRG